MTTTQGLSDFAINPCLSSGSDEATAMAQAIERERDFIHESMAFEEQVFLRHKLTALHGRMYDSAEKSNLASLSVHSAAPVPYNDPSIAPHAWGTSAQFRHREKNSTIEGLYPMLLSARRNVFRIMIRT